MKILNLSLACLFINLVLVPNTSAQDLENTLLWKVEGNGMKPSYIFGTIHVLPQADFEIKPKVKEAMMESEQLVLELDMTNPNLQMEMMQTATMKEGKTLDKLFDPADYAVIDSLMKITVGMGLAMMNTFKPFMINTMLIGRMIEGQPASFEMSLIQMASEQKMTIIGLESIAEQMAVFDAISYESQAEDVLEMINKEQEMRAMYVKMVDLYKNEKLSTLYEMTSDYVDNEDEMNLLLHNRNKNWLAMVPQLTKEKSAFIGVGAAHLGGKSGMIALLRGAGYEVTPIK